MQSNGERTVYPTYALAGARVGVTGASLRVYLSKGGGKLVRPVWSDALGDFDTATVRRIGVDPLTVSAA